MEALAGLHDCEITAPDILAYIAAVVAHPAYTQNFAEELKTPGVRVPVTADPQLWQQAVAVGREIIWLHAYGAAYGGVGRPEDDIRMSAGNPVSRCALLTRLTAREPAQAELTARIFDGRLLTATTLETAGVRWRKAVQDRKPRYAYTSLGTSGTEGQLTFGD